MLVFLTNFVENWTSNAYKNEKQCAIYNRYFLTDVYKN